MPQSLVLVSLVSLAVALTCALWIARDCLRRPQHMAIMNAVWPLCALFGSLPLLWFYLRHGRAPQPHGEDHAQGHDHMHGHGDGDGDGQETPFPIAVAKGALHCGSGCTLGDILAETLAAMAPGVLLAFGWQTVFSERIFAVWGLDFVFAFAIGIVFQYFSIAPMRGLGLRDGLIAALKADTLSLTAWQVGMYGLMAIAVFGVYRPLFGTEPGAASPVFWFTMQLAMIAGFATAYPMNWWLIRKGLKERM